MSQCVRLVRATTAKRLTAKSMNRIKRDRMAALLQQEMREINLEIRHACAHNQSYVIHQITLMDDDMCDCVEKQLVSKLRKAGYMVSYVSRLCSLDLWGGWHPHDTFQAIKISW